MHVRNRRHGHAGGIHARRPEHQVERHRAAAAPTPDAEACRVHPRPTSDGACGARLIIGREHTDLAIDRLAPVAPAQRWCAAVIERDHRVALLRQHQVPQIEREPVVNRRLAGRLTVHIEQHRIVHCRVEVSRIHDYTIECRAITGVDSHEPRRPTLQRRHSRAQLRVLAERSHHRV